MFPDYSEVNGTNYWNPITCRTFPLLPMEPKLDESQKEAIGHALSKQVALIQGPPGSIQHK